MNRYQDNISPEPNLVLTTECYKTPNLQQYSNIFNINQIYPTPPSDNEENSVGEHIRELANKNQITPIIPNGYYYMNGVNRDLSESQDGSQMHSQNVSLDENNQNSKSKITNNEVVQQQVSNRFKRRSRTTYTKSQLDALEATFEKTHYPEIRVVDDLSQMLNLSTERISIWFQNRRARFKKARKLETKENNYAVDKQDSQYSTTYPNSSCFQNMNTISNYNQFYLNDDKMKEFNKLNNSNPLIVPNKLDSYPLMNRNLLNPSFSNQNCSQSTPHLVNSFYQPANSGFTNNIPYYSNNITTDLSQSNSFYQQNMNYTTMNYPSTYQQTSGQQ